MTIFKGKKESGQAAVEFALVFPILLALIMATIEFGWYFTSRYSLGQYSREVGYNVSEPFLLVWRHPTASRQWEDETGGQKPSWLTAEDQARWSFDEYDGWYAFMEPSGTDIIGVNYFYTAFDTPDEFKKRLNMIQTVLDNDMVSYQLRGGWYIKAECMDDMPSNASGWTDTRTRERTEYYYVDVTVDIEYKYYPLTFVGKALFCNPGEDYVLLKEKNRYTYATSPGIYI